MYFFTFLFCLFAIFAQKYSTISYFCLKEYAWKIKKKKKKKNAKCVHGRLRSACAGPHMNLLDVRGFSE